MEASDKKDYEISFLAREEVGAHEVLRTVSRLGGEVILEGPLERIALAYKIEKEISAYFGYFHFRFSPDGMKSLRHELETNKAVLRFLIIHPPLVKAKPRLAPRIRPQPVLAPVPVEVKKMPSLPLSNEALERKIEEILQE